MTLISLSGLDGLANHRRQKQSYWTHAANRIREKTVFPIHEPRFTFDRRDSLFAIGSCFVRRIEQAFLRRNMDCLSVQGYDRASFELFGKAVNPNYINKYTTFSILNELRWALDPACPFPDEAILEMENGSGLDLQAAPHLDSGSLPRGTPAEIKHRHQILISDVTKAIQQAKVIVITLGLVELWKDHETGLFTNASPFASQLEKQPGRFTFEVTDFQENLACLEEIHQLITRFCREDVNIVVTTSPIPMAATFSGRDVTISNTYSKAVLRAVAEEWRNRHENIDYFPSYEMVMLSDRDRVWDDDLIHVSDAFADVIVDYFDALYFPKAQA